MGAPVIRASAATTTTLSRRPETDCFGTGAVSGAERRGGAAFRPWKDETEMGTDASAAASGISLAAYLDDRVFANAALATAEPDPADVAGFAAYLDRYRAGLAVEAAAVTAL